MKYPILFWALCACTLFALLLLSIHLQVQRKNPAFTAWAAAGCAFQLLAAIGMAMPRRPGWFALAGRASGWITLALAIAVLLTALQKAGASPGPACATNQVLFRAFAAILFFNCLPIILEYFGIHITQLGNIWLRNVSFYVPALYMVLMFGGAPWTAARITAADVQIGGLRHAHAAWARGMGS